MAILQVYHGSPVVVQSPEIRKSKYTKDFSWGFYCTKDRQQATRWAAKRGSGYVNVYRYTENPKLNVLKFPEMSDEWLDFIAACRNGESHNYDIVEGPMADDQIYNYVSDFLNHNISREAFWELAKFQHPTHQISFNTPAALTCLQFEGGLYVHD